MLPFLTIHLFKGREIPYSGMELAPHWITRTLGVQGNAICAFIGAADVPVGHMVDLEDVRSLRPIYSPKMLHFLAEWFIDSLDVGILLQNLFVGGVYEQLLERKFEVSRRGNDLFFDGRKLSVSIATKSPVSVLFHFGINIETAGTPVPTAGLSELEIDPFAFAEAVLERFSQDYFGWQKARTKVLPR